ncbi:MAG: Uma2 family endonuclease [Acidobacteria bacterium]|nr:Uma2 family endonuclease [Acidobacteriota bacterium]
MAGRQESVAEENLRIPEDAFTYEGFQRWLESDDFPETGRIDYLEGDVYVDMSPEDLQTHGIVKGAIFATLHFLVTGSLGEAYVDRTRLEFPFADFAAEPDAIVVLWDSLKSGKVRYIPAASGQPNRFSKMEGAPDLIVEVLSDSSESKDTKHLPLVYARAGVPELWLADTRNDKVWFQIYALQDGKYIPVKADRNGWMRSPRLGPSFRLMRYPTPISSWYYVLEHREA